MNNLINGWLGRLVICLVVGAFVLTPTASQASRVTPMILEISPTGRGSIARIELTNDSDRDIPYEVQMMRGEISPDGELALTPADDQFIVFPPQSIVEALSQQVFRIQYVGEEAIDRSQVYYLSVRQIPVAFEEGQNQVQVVINYNVLVNVVPDRASPNPVVLNASYVERPIAIPPGEGEAEPSTEDSATDDAIPAVAEKPMEKGILVELGNDGNRYFFAGRSEWSIKAKTTAGEDFEQSFTGDEMAQFIGVGVVAPENSRIFFVPTEKPLETDSIIISVSP